MTRTQTIHNGPMITAWSAVSAFGIGREAFGEGARTGRNPVTALDSQAWNVPDEHAAVAAFDTRAVLGKKGTRTMDRVTGLTVATMAELIPQPVDQAASERTAVVLGTTTGSAESMMRFTEDSLTGEEPHHVDPALMPNVVMNCAAGRCGIWYGIRGPNTTVAGGRLAGVQSLQYAMRLLAAGRAETVLCGAAEEYSHARSWLDRHTRSLDSEPDRTTPLGEGCALFTLRDPGEDTEDAFAQLVTVRSTAVVDGDPQQALRSCVESVLRHNGIASDELWAVVDSGAAGEIGRAERAALAELFTEQVRDRVPGIGAFGDLGAGSGALALSALLAGAEQDASARGRYALLTSVDRDGSVGCALVRVLR